MIIGGAVIGRGQSKCTIKPGFCGDEITSLLFADDESFDRETNYNLLKKLEDIDPHMDMFVFAKKVNCAKFDELNENEKNDVMDCFQGNVPKKINFFTTKYVDTTFSPHNVPKRYQQRFVELMNVLHENGIAHRDLHGANLGLVNNSPVIFDFGNAILTRNPTILADDDHMLQRTFEPDAPRKRKRSPSLSEDSLSNAFSKSRSSGRLSRNSRSPSFRRRSRSPLSRSPLSRSRLSRSPLKVKRANLNFLDD